MTTLQNSSIERPERVYEIDMVIFGTLDRIATLRTVRVLAQTAQGAKRICKARYHRIEIRRTRAIKAQPVTMPLDLIPI